MFISPSATQKAIFRLMSQSQWPDVWKIVAWNTSHSTVHLVGGALYRSLTHALYGGAAPSGHDYDFLVMGEVKRFRLPSDWQWKGTQAQQMPAQPAKIVKRISPTHFLVRPPIPAYNPGQMPCSGSGASSGSGHTAPVRKVPSVHSATAIHKSGLKVDLISIEDIMRQQGVSFREPKTYFSAVPLDIQAIAYNTHTDRLFGPGLKAIETRQVRINNPAALDIYVQPYDISEYARQKVATMPGFTFMEQNVAGNHPCRCDIMLLMQRGCKCGGI